MMQRVTLLLSSLALLLILILASVQLTDKAQAAANPQWEYATLIYDTDDSSVIFTEVDTTEQKQVTESFDTFRTSIKIDDVPVIYYVNIVGRYSWELSIMHIEGPFQLYIFKRPLS